ncbi:MAG: Rrf2 family transcriptional regulator [Chitinophagaceae bacterium]|nr:Rrf2 family transcriptional regulator [Chitinophagaceae bacterium]
MFSKSTEYALRATVFIAKGSTREKKLRLEEITAAIDSPPSFTAKILQKLTREKIISSVPGPNGGFYLSDKAKQLPVLAVLKAMQEEETLNKCILGLKQCSEESPCPMHEQYKSVKQKLKSLFETKTILELAEEL